MSNPQILNEVVEQKVLTLFESILDLTRESAKEWSFESRSNKKGMAVLKIRGGALNVYFDGFSYLLDVKFPDGDYVYIQQIHGPLKGRVNATVSEICDVLMDSPEYAQWEGGLKADERIASSIDKMQASLEKIKESRIPKPEVEVSEDKMLEPPQTAKRRGLLGLFCRGG